MYTLAVRRYLFVILACSTVLRAQTTLRQAGAQRALLMGAAADASEENPDPLTTDPLYASTLGTRDGFAEICEQLIHRLASRVAAGQRGHFTSESAGWLFMNHDGIGAHTASLPRIPLKNLLHVLRKRRPRQHHVAARFLGLLLQFALHVGDEAQHVDPFQLR
jgi:hypothetical protein